MPLTRASQNFKREQSMAGLTRAIRKFVRQDDGAALVEYAILIALIAVICLIVVATVGNKVSQKFSEVADKL
jgi:pilus assembly protein Flp/PilA